MFLTPNKIISEPTSLIKILVGSLLHICADNGAAISPPIAKPITISHAIVLRNAVKVTA